MWNLTFALILFVMAIISVSEGIKKDSFFSATYYFSSCIILSYGCAINIDKYIHTFIK